MARDDNEESHKGEGHRAWGQGSRTLEPVIGWKELEGVRDAGTKEELEATDAGTKQDAGGHIWKLAGRVTVSRQRHERTSTFSRWAVKTHAGKAL